MSDRDQYRPRLAIRLLRARLPDDAYEFVLGDLEERYAGDIVPRLGSAAARRWYWMEIARLAFARWPRPLRVPSTRPQPDALMRMLFHDLRFGFRLMGRNPGMSAIAILTLALGIGANSAIFSVVNRVLLDPGPFPQADRLMSVYPISATGAENNLGFLTIQDLQRENRSLESSAAMSYWEPALSGLDAPERLKGQRVGQQFFHALGVRLLLGRDFLPAEDHRGANRVAILSYGFWQRRFGGDSAIVGHTITLSDNAYQVVGVLPQTFESLLAPGTEIFGPLGYEPDLPWACRTCQHLRMVARLRDGITREAAVQDLNRVYSAVVREHPKEYADPKMTMVPLHDYVTRDVRPALLTLLGAVAFVLLIACANVINLLLGRAVRRRGEFALRTALGAERVRIIRMVLGESLAMALCAGAAGIAAAFAGVAWLVGVAPAGLPRMDQIHVDGSVLVFSLGLTLAAGLVSGLVPALIATRSDLHALIKSGTRSLAGSRHRVRGGFVVAEVSLAVMLLAGATLLVRSLGMLLAVPPGFEPGRLLTVEVDAAGKAYSDSAAVFTFYDRVLDAVRAVPGVTSAATTTLLPLGGNWDSYGVHSKDNPRANPEEDPSALRYAVTPEFLRTMKIPLLEGRDFDERDNDKSPHVLLINETLARTVFGSASPLGRQLRVGGNDGPWRTIVGVTKNVRHRGLDAQDEKQLYLPSVQWAYIDNSRTLVIRTSVSPAAIIPAVRRAIWSVDRTVPIARVATMDDIISRTTEQRRFIMWLFELFTLLALGLSAAGIYGVLSASVAERTREIGVRTALGASRQRILSAVVRDGARLTGIGLVIGVVGAFALGSSLRGLLFGVAPHDPASLALVVAAAGTVALLASAIPAWRATRVDPVEALRGE